MRVGALGLLLSCLRAQHCINSYCSTISDCGSGCNSCAPDGVCSGQSHTHAPHGHNPHTHNPHGHQPHTHTPHTHSPAPHPHSHKPAPTQCSWPTFASRNQLFKHLKESGHAVAPRR